MRGHTVGREGARIVPSSRRIPSGARRIAIPQAVTRGLTTPAGIDTARQALKAGATPRPEAAADGAAAANAAAAAAAAVAKPTVGGSSSNVGSGAQLSSSAAAPSSSSSTSRSSTGSGDDSDHWIDQRGRDGTGGEDADRLSPRLSAGAQAERATREAGLRADAAALVASHVPAEAAADRHHWLVFTVPERPVAGADCVVYFNRTQSEPLAHSGRLSVQFGFNRWDLAGGKVDLEAMAGAAIPSVDGSAFFRAVVPVPADAYEVNMVFGDDQGHYDNNQGQDWTFAADGGPTFEEWVDGAADRAMKAEAEEAAAREAAEREAKAAALAAALQRDEAEARGAVEELRGSYGWLREGALPLRKVEAGGGGAAVTLWRTEPAEPSAGGRFRLLYNSRAGPLLWVDPKQGHAAPRLTYGFNNWRLPGGEPVEMRPARPAAAEAAAPAAADAAAATAAAPASAAAAAAADDGGLWWEAELEAPESAASMSFCVSSGDAWDNNDGGDHKLLVSPPARHASAADPVAAWLDGLVPPLRDAARARREAAEAAAAAKLAKRDAERAELRGSAMGVLRRQLRHVLFTEPEVVRAGEKVTVYYSPASTPLAGREQVYITAGFNRWSHARGLGPAAMKPPGPGGMHHRATFMVPRDAHVLDVVLSDVPGGEGTYDNRGGLDYHVPVEGGVGARPRPLHVVHVAVEMAPIAKVGGLGDVVTSLGRAVQDQGHLVEVILPWHQFFGASPLLGGRQFEAEFDWGGTRIVVTSCLVEGVRAFFVDAHNGFFQTPSVYTDRVQYDEMRFDFFCRAALEFLLQTGRQPDILHCHDWQTAHVAKAYWDDYHRYGLHRPRVVFTIHNLNYGAQKVGEAAYYCQKFTTVSPSYASEVSGHPAIAAHTHKFMGILNGIDPELWDPQEDPWLPSPYTADTCAEGKAAARAELRRRLQMSPQDDRLIVAVVSRLTGQKGVHLIKHAAWRTRDRGGQFVLLGSAPDPKVQGEFDALAGQLSGGHDNNAGFCFFYDEPLSHLIYAAADIVVVPSMFEPCGLTQMIAMRYGAVPVVRHTGGLHDTVFDVDTDKARAAWEVAGSTDPDADGPQCTNGFAFEGTDGGALDYALNRAIDAYYNDRDWFRSLQSRVMRMDWSWNRPALSYVDLYYAALK